MKIIHQALSASPFQNGFQIITDAAEVRLLFLTDDIIRVRAGFSGSFREHSYSLVMTAWEDETDGLFSEYRKRITPASAQMHEEADRFVFQGRRLKVCIQKDPYVMQVFDSDGTMIHSDIPDLALRMDSNLRRIHTSRLEDDDCFYGFGEKTGRLNKKEAYMVMSPGDSLGYNAEKTDSLYKHIPFYIRLNRTTRRAAGYFYHCTGICDFNMGREIRSYWHHYSTFRAESDDIDLFLIAGPSVRDIIRRYTDLTGKSALLPVSALGYLASSMYYAELPENCDQGISSFMDICARKGIPADGFMLSSGYTLVNTDDGEKRCTFTWNRKRFPNPERFMKDMKERGISVIPNVKPGMLKIHPKLGEMMAEGLFISKDGVPCTGTWWGGPGYFTDFTDPRARSAWKKLLRENVIRTGTDCIWDDNCEYDSMIDDDAPVSYEGYGETIRRCRSVMSNIMAQTAVEAVHEEHPDARPFVVSRSGHAGIQRYAQTWAGDNYTRWESLKYNIATILGMSLSGVANQGCDIGGFYGPKPEPELLVRWVQNGIYQPRFSIHSWNTDGSVTEPWMYPEVTGLIRDAMQFRSALSPYLYSLMYRAHTEGLPIMEPLCSAFQDDPEGYDEDVDFMLGDGLFAACVVEKGAASRRIRFPRGVDFTDFYTRRRFQGGTVIDLPVDLSSRPLFIRSASIVPLAENKIMNLASDPVTDLKLLIEPSGDCSFDLYQDDGVSMDYLKGAYLLTHISLKAGKETVVDFRHEGSYTGYLRRMHIDMICPDQPPAQIRIGNTVLKQYPDGSELSSGSGWFFDEALKSVQIMYPALREDFSVVISF